VIDTKYCRTTLNHKFLNWQTIAQRRILLDAFNYTDINDYILFDMQKVIESVPQKCCTKMWRRELTLAAHWASQNHLHIPWCKCISHVPYKVFPTFTNPYIISLQSSQHTMFYGSDCKKILDVKPVEDPFNVETVQGLGWFFKIYNFKDMDGPWISWMSYQCKQKFVPMKAT
jgi:hypothetical protein